MMRQEYDLSSLKRLPPEKLYFRHRQSDSSRNPKEIKLTTELIAALNEELAYQTSLSAQPGRADNVDHGVAGQLVTLSVYARKAEEAWVMNAGDTESLDALRKVAGIAVRALLLYGCPRRGNLIQQQQAPSAAALAVAARMQNG